MKVLLFLLLATPLSAGELSDAIFKPAVLQGLQDDLHYTHRLQLPDTAEVSDTLVLAPDADRLALTRDAKPVTDFSRDSAHPVLMYFLESTVRHMAEATGGSPFYIRNRIRDALIAAPMGADVVPFAGDPNQAKMGAFGDLTLRFGFDGQSITSLSADAGGYTESMTLVEE